MFFIVIDKEYEIYMYKLICCVNCYFYGNFLYLDILYIMYVFFGYMLSVLICVRELNLMLIFGIKIIFLLRNCFLECK